MLGSTKFYGWLLRLYPACFREEYQTPMKCQFQDEFRDAYSRLDRARLWLHAVWDLATSAPGEVLSELRLDLKHAIRVYRSRFLSTALAVIALGLAIGASTGIFSVLNALLLRSLPFSDPAQLVELWLSPVSAMSGRAAFSRWYRRSAYLQGYESCCQLFLESPLESSSPWPWDGTWGTCWKMLHSQPYGRA